MTKPKTDDVIGGLRRELSILQERAENAAVERDKWTRRAAVYELMAETVAGILDRQAAAAPGAGVGADPPAWEPVPVLPAPGSWERPLPAICATMAPFVADASNLAKLAILS